MNQASSSGSLNYLFLNSFISLSFILIVNYFNVDVLYKMISVINLIYSGQELFSYSFKDITKNHNFNFKKSLKLSLQHIYTVSLKKFTFSLEWLNSAMTFNIMTLNINVIK